MDVLDVLFSSSDSVGRADNDRLSERSLEGDLRKLRSEGARERLRLGIWGCRGMLSGCVSISEEGRARVINGFRDFLVGIEGTEAF